MTYPDRKSLHSLAVLFAVSLVMAPTLGFAQGFTLTGYARQYVSMNLEDQPETAADDKGDIQMLRTSLFLEGRGDTGPLSWLGRFRFSKDFRQSYEKRLEDLTAVNSPLGFLPPTRADFEDEYDEADIRELFFEWNPHDRVNLVLGKQQVVWGETDFFHATDVIHGFDFRWRSFLVPENEDVRKPLVMANVNIDVPEANGELQLLLRPGIDPEDHIGNFIPAFGGRWSNRLAKGVNLIGAAPFNFDFEDADTDDPHYGFRWSGSFGKNDDVNYAVSFYHGQGGFQQDPILIFNPAAGALQFVFPETDTVGASATGYIAGIDTVWRAEFAYTPDRKLGDAMGNILEKDAWNFVLGLDKTLRLQKVLKTTSQSLFTVQVFDWYLPDVEKSDNIINFVGSGPYDEHNIIATGILQLPYMADRLIVTLVGLWDITEGDGSFIPSVEYQLGPHWRFKVEGDFFFSDNTSVAGEPSASVFGALEDNDQLLLRITYLF